MFAPIGAAAGLAAAFNAPISAILFVIEEVIGSWSAAVLGSLVLSAISSVVVARWFWGPEPLFRIPSIALRDPRELMAYAVLGVFGGLLAPVFSLVLGYLRPRLRALPRWTQFLQPAVAGLLVGAIGFFGFPQVMGTGYDVIDQAMHGQFVWQILLALVFLKLLATTFSFSSGTPGGMFAPTLFIGAMLGGAVGAFEKHFFPHLTGTIGAYSLVGMGVLFAGFLRAPLTSVFMVLEVSGNYSIVLPIILANTLAFLISRGLQPVGIFEIFTQQDGLDLPSMEEQREESVLHIEDALQPASVPIIDGSDTLQAVSQAISEFHATACLVRLMDGSWYAMSTDELNGAAATLTPDTAVQRALKTDRTPALFPDMPLDSALHFFPRWPLLPVLNRASRGTVEGMLTLDDVLRCYRGSE
jgi:CIC family chloride channel protein